MSEQSTLSVYWDDSFLEHNPPAGEFELASSERLAVDEPRPNRPERVQNIKHILDHELSEFLEWEIRPVPRVRRSRTDSRGLDGALTFSKFVSQFSSDHLRARSRRSVLDGPTLRPDRTHSIARGRISGRRIESSRATVRRCGSRLGASGTRTCACRRRSRRPGRPSGCDAECRSSRPRTPSPARSPGDP